MEQEKEISLQIEPDQSEQVPPVIPGKKNDFEIPAILLVIVLLIAGGVYYFKFFNRPKACTSEAMVCPDGSAVARTGPNCEFAPCPQSPVSPALDETTNWKTYQNAKFGYFFHYPNTWVLEETGNSVSLGILENMNEFSLQINANSGKLGLSDWITDIEENETWQENDEEIIVGGVEAIKLIKNLTGIETGEKLKRTEIFFPKDDLIFQFKVSGFDQEIIDQILSTFKFLDGSTFEQEKVGLFTVKKSDYSIDGVSFDSELYELKNEGVIAPGPEDDSYLFAKSSNVDLNNFVGKEVKLRYHYVVGDIRSEQQMVIVDSVLSAE